MCVCVWFRYGHRSRINSVTQVPRPVTGSGPAAATATDGAFFASCSDKGHLRVWDARQHRQVAHHLVPLPAKVVAASPDGLSVAVGFSDGSFALYDLTDVCLECTTAASRQSPPDLMPRGENGSATAAGAGAVATDALQMGRASATKVGFGSSSTRKSFSNVGRTHPDREKKPRPNNSSDGHSAAAAESDNVSQMTSASSAPGRSNNSGTFRSVSAMSFSPDGSMLAVASNDSRIHVWKAKSKCVCKAHCDFQLYATLRGHVAGVTGMDWSSNSGYLRSCCQTHELLYVLGWLVGCLNWLKCWLFAK